MAAVQSAPRSDREGDPRADATWKRVWSWLLGRSSNARQGSVLGGSGIEGELLRTSAMKTTSAQPTGNSSSLRPRASSGGGQRGGGRLDHHGQEQTAEDDLDHRSRPPCPRALCQARRPTHSSAKPRAPYSAALMARSQRGAGPAGTPAAPTASATPLHGVGGRQGQRGGQQAGEALQRHLALAATRPRATPTQTSSDQDTVLRSRQQGPGADGSAEPAATSSWASCSRSPSRIASQATRSNTHGPLGGVGLRMVAFDRSTGAAGPSNWLRGDSWSAACGPAATSHGGP